MRGREGYKSKPTDDESSTYLDTITSITALNAMVGKKLLILYCVHLHSPIRAVINLAIDGPDLLDGPKLSLSQNPAQRNLVQCELGNYIELSLREELRFRFQALYLLFGGGHLLEVEGGRGVVGYHDRRR